MTGWIDISMDVDDVLSQLSFDDITEYFKDEINELLSETKEPLEDEIEELKETIEELKNQIETPESGE